MVSIRTKDKKVIQCSWYGFKEGKSCLNKLIAFCNNMTVLVNERRKLYFIYFDISEDFSTVSHNILIDKQMK